MMKHYNKLANLRIYAAAYLTNFSNDVELKLAKFLQLIGTIKRTIITKVRTETILKLYNTSFAYISIWVRKQDFDSLTETKN